MSDVSHAAYHLHMADTPSAEELTFDDESWDPTDSLTDEEADDLNAAEIEPASVVYSGQDFDVYGLVRRLQNEDILVPTFGHSDERISSAGFQRSFVWNRPQMDRFIESLLLGYPIPGIFLVRQADSRYLVLDGQQRLRTLQYFYEGVYQGKEFSLKNVGRRFKGLTYKALREDQRRIIDNAFFQATIVDSDGSPQALEAIYQIFERLNAGGTQLTPHEIRVALYAGPFIDYLETLNQLPSWRGLYGKKSPRVRDQELILRIVALHDSSHLYSRPLKTFLNDFVARNRYLDGFDADEFERNFDTAATLILEGVGRNAIRPRNQVNAALTEALFYGLIQRLYSEKSVPDAQAVRRAITRIMRDSGMQEAISRSTADEEAVKKRLGVSARAMMTAK